MELEDLLGAGGLDRGTVRKRSAHDRPDKLPSLASGFLQRPSLDRPESVHPGEETGLRAEHADVERGRGSNWERRDYPSSGETAKRPEPTWATATTGPEGTVIHTPGCKTQVNRG
jgi:hypothetical protein